MSKKERQGHDEQVHDATEDMEDTTSSEQASATDTEPQKEDSASEQLSKELEEQRDKYLRLAAEFDNYRKRTSRETLEIRQTASRDLMTSMLEVLDDIDRAQAQINETEEKTEMLEGVVLIFNKFRKILEQKGLKAIETLHTEFDVEKDEAIAEVPVDDENLKGKVVDEIQKGYMLNDRLIRFAKVVVGK